MGWFRSLFSTPRCWPSFNAFWVCKRGDFVNENLVHQKNKLGKRKLRKPNPTSEPFSRADCSAHHLAHQQGTGILVNFMQPQSLNYGFPRFCRISSIRPTDSRKSPQTKHILSSVRTGPQCSKCSSAGCRLFWAANKISFLLFRGLFFLFSDHNVQHCEFPTRKRNQIFHVDRSSVALPKQRWSEMYFPL